MALKTALVWAGAQTVTRMMLSFISIKVTAVFLGPSGLALIGQLSNFLSLLQGALGSAIETGVIKSTAEAAGNKPRLNLLWGTGSRLAVVIGAFVALVLCIIAQPVSAWLLSDEHYWPVVVCVAVCMPFVLISLVFTGALNGLKQISALGFAGVCSTVAGALFFIPLCYLFGILGGLIGVVVASFMVFVTSSTVAWKSGHIRPREFMKHWDPHIARNIIAFYPMLLVHAVGDPLTFLLVRDGVIDALGMTNAGIWQANLRLSEMYTQVLVAAFSLYLMQHLSSISDDRRFLKELRVTVVKLSSLTALGAAMIYISRDLIIAIVLTEEFHSVRDVLPLQLIGDVLKMSCWPLKMALVIRMRTGWYMLVELILAAIQVALSRYWLPELALDAAPAAHATAWGSVFLLLVCAYWGFGQTSLLTSVNIKATSAR